MSEERRGLPGDGVPVERVVYGDPTPKETARDWAENVVPVVEEHDRGHRDPDVHRMRRAPVEIPIRNPRWDTLSYDTETGRGDLAPGDKEPGDTLWYGLDVPPKPVSRARYVTAMWRPRGRVGNLLKGLLSRGRR